MSPHFYLIVHNIVAVASVIVLLAMAFFTFLNGKRQTANVAFACMLIAAAVFYISHVVGVNVTDPVLSRTVLMFNISIFFIGAFNVHATLAMLGHQSDRRKVIVAAYVGAIGFSTLFLTFPELFLQQSTPKMYFPNYYEPGEFNWIRLTYLYVMVVPYLTYVLAKAYYSATVVLEKYKLKYLLLALIAGYGFGFIPNFLVYGVQVDPLWGMPFALIFAVPFAYGAIRYELFNIKVIAKQAFFYGISVVGVGVVIIFLNNSNDWIRMTFPGFPIWTIALASALLVVTVAVLIWRNLREGDILKYEFITTVTHKFRTPLTAIKWASEELSKGGSPEEMQEQIRYIQSSTAKLVELTNILVQASGKEDSGYEYKMQEVDFSALTREVVQSFAEHITPKHLEVIEDVEPHVTVKADPDRLTFVLQILLENAIHYTPAYGKVSVTLKQVKNVATLSVKDTGIGLDKNEIARLFSKFYRGTDARAADTEGLGLGLFIARKIMTHFNGEIWAESEGLGKGSTFNISLRAQD